MAIVDFTLGVHVLGATRVSATVPIDDATIDPDTGNPAPDVDFEGPITLIIEGPGRVILEVWRIEDGPDSGRNPWRSSLGQFPDGMTEADSPFIIPTGGAVQSLDDIPSWRTTVWNP